MYCPNPNSRRYWCKMDFPQVNAEVASHDASKLEYLVFSNFAQHGIQDKRHLCLLGAVQITKGPLMHTSKDISYLYILND